MSYLVLTDVKKSKYHFWASLLKIAAELNVLNEQKYTTSILSVNKYSRILNTCTPYTYMHNLFPLFYKAKSTVCTFTWNKYKNTYTRTLHTLPLCIFIYKSYRFDSFFFFICYSQYVLIPIWTIIHESGNFWFVFGILALSLHFSLSLFLAFVVIIVIIILVLLLLQLFAVQSLLLIFLCFHAINATLFAVIRRIAYICMPVSVL